VGEERLRVIVNGRGQSSVLVHLNNIVVRAAVVHIDLVLVGEALEDRYGLVKDKASYLGEPAGANIEAAVATEPDPGLAVLVLDDTHLAYSPHSAYFLVVKGIRHPAAVEEVIVAFLLTSLKLVNSSSAYEVDSYSVGLPMNSWSANDLGEGRHRRYLRKLPPARNSKHVHID
jgi:hypothetical protein